MIFVKLEGYDFKYQVEDVLRLFYGNEKIVFIDDDLQNKGSELYFHSRLESSDKCTSLNNELFYDNELKISSSYDLTDFITEKQCCENFIESNLFKREIKRLIYNDLKEYTLKRLPWGMLTGIRPSKIVHEMMDRHLSEQEILDTLTGYYDITPQKANLLYNIAKVERKVLDGLEKDTVSLYIGIPFCTTRCLYCSFTSNSIDKYSKSVPAYIKSLKKEMEEVSKIIGGTPYKIQSIYIGGGTPTSIDENSLKELLSHVEKYFDLRYLKEYTLEAGRPDSINEEKLNIIKASRVNRISINPQTMNNDTLKLIGRNHSAEDIVEKFRLAKKLGFDNINMDVIAGLPGENIDDFKTTLEKIHDLMPESITVHTMSIKRASKLNESIDKYDLTQGSEVEKMVDFAADFTRNMNMHPYYLYRQKNMLGNLENIGYCREGYESIYNIQIMDEKQTIIALGAGGVTKVVYTAENRIERAFNVKSVEEYISRIDEMIERKNALLALI